MPDSILTLQGAMSIPEVRKESLEIAAVATVDPEGSLAIQG